LDGGPVIVFLFSISILILSQAATLVRFAAADPLAICFWRLLLAGLMLVPFVNWSKARIAFRSFSRADWLQLLLSGIFLFTHFYFFFRSVQETSVANATIIFSLNPVTTALGAWLLFRERVSVHLIAACALGFAGVVILFLERAVQISHLSSLPGDIFGVISAICFTGYILTGKRIRLKLENAPYAMAIYLQTVIFSGAAMLLTSVPFLGYSQTTWEVFLALAIFPTLLGHAVFTYCLNHLNVNFMSCATLIEPVFAAATAVYLFNEPITSFASVGFLLTCASVLVLYWPLLFSKPTKGAGHE
jgi:drug/metabolite transporter (DMT)-like permease